MKTISVSEFKRRCLSVVSEVNATRVPMLITKRGRPFARLVPAGRVPKFIGRLKGVFKVVGDIESPEQGEYDRQSAGRSPAPKHSFSPPSRNTPAPNA